MSELTKVGIVGAGLMGPGLAQIFARGGCQVNIYDTDREALAATHQRISRNFEPFLNLGLAEPDEIEPTLARITLTEDLAALCHGRDFIIEAVTERLELKRRIFAEMERLVPASTILSSNTSAISISKIAAGLAHPERVVGTHFWNPPQVVPGVEVIKAAGTSPETMETVYRLLAEMGKRPVRVMKDVPGFLGNRMQHALWREAIHLVEAGIASAEDVDDVVRYTFGLRLAFLGPLATADLAGLDLTHQVHEDLLPDLDRSPGPSPLLTEKIEQGRLGAKSGQGFHHWSPDRLRGVIGRRDEVLLKIIREVLPPRTK
jgi:3-hydroxybutyryl-CoA dehydrogenase